MPRNNNSYSDSSNIRQAYEARLKRRAAANPGLYHKPLRWRKISPKEKYDLMKEAWYFHDSSWYMRNGSRGFDGQGCNQYHCIPECKYYGPYNPEAEEEDQNNKAVITVKSKQTAKRRSKKQKEGNSSRS